MHTKKSTKSKINKVEVEFTEKEDNSIWGDLVYFLLFPFSLFQSVNLISRILTY